MHIAIVVNSFPNLSESFIYNKVMGLRAAGLDVTVLAQNRQNDLEYYRDRLNGVPTKCIRYSPTTGLFLLLPIHLAHLCLQRPNAAASGLAKAIRAYGFGRRALKAWVKALPLLSGGYALIHFEFSGLATTYLDAIPLVSSAKFLTSCRGSAEQIVPLVQRDRAEKLRRLFSLLDRVHCVTADIQRTTQRYGLRASQAFVNHPSIPQNYFQRRIPYSAHETGPYSILSVGRLHWKKGYEFGLLAVKQLLEAGDEVIYQIIGGGPEAEKLRFTIEDLGLKRHAFLMGKQPSESVREALEAADVFLLPSLSEGLSNAALEAMAMEVPVVSTAVGGMDELIEDGREGYLAPPHDPQALADKVNKLIRNPSLRRAMGRAGREKVARHFNLDRHIACFLSEYQQLVDGH